MAEEHNLVLITQNDDITELVNPKLALLRSFDKIVSCKYQKALDVIEKSNPNSVIIHADEEKKTLDLIKKIKSFKPQMPLILLLDEYNRDFIINCFDEKIDDYMVLKSDDTDFLMRVIWSMKKNALAQKNKEYFEILEDLRIINKQSGIYSIKYSSEILSSEVVKIIRQKNDAVFILISLDENSKSKISVKNFVNIIKSSVRTSDILAHMQGNRIAILLKKTNLDGANTVINKIEGQLENGLKIHAGICEVLDDDFNKLLNQCQDALFQAVNKNVNAVITTEIEEKSLAKNWLDDVDLCNKNFKLFKIKFNKKMEKVIVPAFYKIQKSWETKLFDTKIEQKVCENASIFALSNENQSGFVRITYPGFAKVKVDIVFQGLDSPENRQIDLDLKTLDENDIATVLEDFIKEFKKLK